MKIAILCSSPKHPVNSYLERWVAKHAGAHEIYLARYKSELHGGDLLFLISCTEVISADTRSAFRKVLIIHASDLPRGRGWSPHIWQIVEGREQVVVSLLEAADKVDSGDIWHKMVVSIARHALWDEINHLIFSTELDLMDYAIDNFARVRPQPQDQAVAPTYYRKRCQDDSRIDPERSISAQFDLIRVCDPERYPAFFQLHGHKYALRVEKIDE